MICADTDTHMQVCYRRTAIRPNRAMFLLAGDIYVFSHFMVTHKLKHKA